jgi:hypothetical protein
MNKKFSIKGLILIVCFLPTCLTAEHIKETFTKKITEEFNIKSNGETSISNKYGPIVLNHWDKNTVKISVQIEVKASTKREANILFDGIKIEFSNSESNVSASTVIEFKNSNNNIQSLGDFLSSFFSNKLYNEFKINYEVWMPHENNVNITLKYGDLTGQNIGGDANIDVKYGNFTLNEVKGNTTILLGYGNGTLVKTKNLSAEVKYSNLKAEEVLKSNLEYATVTMKQAKDLTIQSGYDTYKIGGVERLDIEAKYGTYSFSLGQQAESIKLLGSYAGFTLRLPFDNAFEFYTVGKYLSVKFPESVHFKHKRIEGSYKEFKGYYKSTRGFFLEADCKYGSLHMDPRGL